MSGIRQLFMVINVAVLFMLIGTILVTSGIVLHMLWGAEIWTLEMYLGLLNVSAILLIAIYGVLTSYQDKVTAAKKARLGLTDEKSPS